MTDLRKAAEMALTALETSCPNIWPSVKECLRQALAQPEQEPVAWEHFYTPDSPFYIAPPKREWVGLTDEEICFEYQKLWPFHPAEEPRLTNDILEFTKAIEAKLKEKNGG